MCSFKCPVTAPPAFLDRGLANGRGIHINRRRCRRLSTRVIPLAIAVRVARVDVLRVPPWRSILPDGDPFRSTAVARVEGFHVEPSTNRNEPWILRRLWICRTGVVIS
jgi:hypothetical protein